MQNRYRDINREEAVEVIDTSRRELSDMLFVRYQRDDNCGDLTFKNGSELVDQDFDYVELSMPRGIGGFGLTVLRLLRYHDTRGRPLEDYALDVPDYSNKTDEELKGRIPSEDIALLRRSSDKVHTLVEKFLD